jgi:hypothetical protein
MRASIAASILVVAGAAGAAVPPDFHQPALGAIADRMHTMAVEVVARVRAAVPQVDDHTSEALR